MTTEPAASDYTDADIEQLLDQLWRENRPAPELPRWLPVALALLPFVLISVTAINGLIGLIAIITPLLAAGSWSGLSDGLYHAYSFICPQRPDHTFFLSGHPMAFEQRDLSMHIGFAVAGLLYLRVRFLRRPVSTVWLVVGVAPMLIDVAISTVGLLPATAISRTWTGALASFFIVWWSYPRFDAMLVKVQDHVEKIRSRIAGVQTSGDQFVLSEAGRETRDRMHLNDIELS